MNRYGWCRWCRVETRNELYWRLPHLGARCAGCRAHRKWVPLSSEEARHAPPRPPPAPETGDLFAPPEKAP